MELFIFASGVGTLVLLAGHLLDYTVESTFRPLSALHVRTPDEEVPNGDVLLPLDTVEEYDRAA
jgi:hypothetical protein